jgi:hypothetical protein
MDKFIQNLIIVITVILLIFIIQITIDNYDKENTYKINNIHNTNKNNRNIRNNLVENFAGVDATNITSFEPRQGDSSTIVTITGSGLDHIGEVTFEDVECVIFEDRTDTEMKILPPSLTELGKTIQEVRDIMNKGEDIGLPIKKIKILRRINITKQDGISPSDAIILDGIRFYYIDKINYLDNCPKLEEPPKPEPEPIEEEVDINREVLGSDMEFVKEILPKKMKQLQALIDKQNEIINYYEALNIDNNNIEYLSKIQALETLNNMKKEYNIQRYNIHKTIGKRYEYSF